MNKSRWCWLPVLALCAAGCASSKGARSSPPGSSATEQRAAELEARNAAMQQELRGKQGELSQSFQAMAQAEAAAGLTGLGCVGVAPANAQLQGLPRSGAVHARFLLRSQPHQMTVTFSPPRTSGKWRLSQGTCTVTP
ncbi:hypothetical protein [Archangium sp.]|jgi:hypothetical protein|uniref:hypothetical protein n=1 Tax=Archangium sp. TaxID=1872627 RepID=UPI002EDAB38E